MTTAELDSLVVAYVGNFGPPHSTENHVAAAFESHGATVLRLQENDVRSWQFIPHLNVDLLLWTHTHWPLDNIPIEHTLYDLREHGVPIVGFHLDRWWGLPREAEITGAELAPFFTVDILITADGGHDKEWHLAGIDHRWMPPAVSLAEAAELGHRVARYQRPVAFIGSWQQYHPEWPHRRQLIEWARKTYGRQLGLYPEPGRGAVRGRDLADLYASVDVVIGDSCMIGGSGRYWSDRIPETLGRGGFLLHPDVEGLGEQFPEGTIVTWPVGDFARLGQLVEQYRDDVDARRQVIAAGRAHVLEHHTYERRALQIVEILNDEGLIL